VRRAPRAQSDAASANGKSKPPSPRSKELPYGRPISSAVPIGGREEIPDLARALLTLFSLIAQAGRPVLQLRQQEAAEALAVSERTLWAWTKEGIVPYHRINGTVLYPVEQLRAWLAERCAETAADLAAAKTGESDSQ